MQIYSYFSAFCLLSRCLNANKYALPYLRKYITTVTYLELKFSLKKDYFLSRGHVIVKYHLNFGFSLE